MRNVRLTNLAGCHAPHHHTATSQRDEGTLYTGQAREVLTQGTQAFQPRARPYCEGYSIQLFQEYTPKVVFPINSSLNLDPSV